jgi:hypothetical protein
MIGMAIMTVAALGHVLRKDRAPDISLKAHVDPQFPDWVPGKLVCDDLQLKKTSMMSFSYECASRTHQ